MSQRGSLTLALPLVLILLLIAAFLILSYTGIIKNPLSKQTSGIQTMYENPFDKSTAQYANPFSNEYQNPFENLQ